MLHWDHMKNKLQSSNYWANKILQIDEEKMALY